MLPVYFTFWYVLYVHIQVTESILSLLLKRLEEDKERSFSKINPTKNERLFCIMCASFLFVICPIYRMHGSEVVESVLECCIRVHKSVCQMARLVSSCKTAVLSFQLSLKVAEMMDVQIVKVKNITNHCHHSTLISNFQL